MDVCINPNTNPQTGKEYYVYILVYVDDFLHINHNPEIFMRELKVAYRLKYGSLVPPTRSLGANVYKVKLDDGYISWSTTGE